MLLQKKAKLYTLPKNEIQIYISSLMPESAYIVGYYGDGLLTVGGTKSLDKRKQIISKFEKGAQDAGKSPENMSKAIEIHVEYGVDFEASIENRKKFWAGAKVHALA
jgi:alkanesulfonate monooxygenase SsuD/methylene tetrahydromethanopterin reductase-like flavin-dependent oxidoreductase (luciferase family)